MLWAAQRFMVLTSKQKNILKLSRQRSIFALNGKRNFRTGEHRMMAIRHLIWLLSILKYYAKSDQPALSVMQLLGNIKFISWNRNNSGFWIKTRSGILLYHLVLVWFRNCYYWQCHSSSCLSEGQQAKSHRFQLSASLAGDRSDSDWPLLWSELPMWMSPNYPEAIQPKIIYLSAEDFTLSGQELTTTLPVKMPSR